MAYFLFIEYIGSIIGSTALHNAYGRRCSDRILSIILWYKSQVVCNSVWRLIVIVFLCENLDIAAKFPTILVGCKNSKLLKGEQGSINY